MKKRIKNVNKSRLFGGVVAAGFLGLSFAEANQVDSEILLLVDGQTFSNNSFDLILDSIASAFEQQSFIDDVASGPFGTIAASLTIFNAGQPSTQIPWMELSTPSDLQNFASSVRNVVAPPSFGLVSYVDAIAAGAASIANSSAEGTVRQITIVEDGGFFLFSDTAAEIQAASDAALASGVDVINSVVFNAGGGNNRQQVIQDYYDANVVAGGGEATVIGGTTFGAPGGAVGDAIQDGIVESVTEPTINANALAAVPEPTSFSLILLSGSVLFLRRRRA